MRMGLFRTGALVASILVGASAGLVAADLRDADPGQQPPSSAPTDSPSDSPDDGPGVLDPLDLGTSMENLDCTKDTILVIDRGEDRAALRTAVVDYPEAKYLKTAD